MRRCVLPGRPAVAALGMALAVSVCLSACATSETGKAKRETKRQAREAQRRDALRAVVADCLPAPDEKPAPDVAGLYTALIEGGNWEAVRHCYRIAVRALAAGRHTEAARLLDGALRRIEASSAGEKSARKARSPFHGESKKNYRGEPYEQAMLYLLRGLLYMHEGEYENARAVFRSGALRDASSLDAPKEQQYQADLAEMDYLEGLCNLKLQSANAADNFRFARTHARRASAVYGPPPDFNTVLAVFAGRGPAKYSEGRYGQYLRFRRGDGTGAPLDIYEGNTLLASVGGPIDNLTFQATTRGGREIDAILKGKAIFKTSGKVLGGAAVVVGASRVLDNSGGSESSAIVALVGLVILGIAAAANPAADTRELEPLPDDIYLVALQLDAGDHRFELRSGPHVRFVNVRHKGGDCEVTFVREGAWSS